MSDKFALKQVRITVDVKLEHTLISLNQKVKTLVLRQFVHFGLNCSGGCRISQKWAPPDDGTSLLFWQFLPKLHEIGRNWTRGLLSVLPWIHQ